MDQPTRHVREFALPTADAAERLGLALSGPGLRATLFHLGGLRRLNELGLVSVIDGVSATAGGAIIAGLLAKVWGRFEVDGIGRILNFDDLVSRPIRMLARRGLGPEQWRRSRWSWSAWFGGPERSESGLLADLIDERLFGGLQLREIPDAPRFTWVATNLSTGGRWEFQRNRMGEEALGHVIDPEIRLADAVVAAALPVARWPAVELKLDPYRYHRGSAGETADRLRSHVPLSEGTLIDNLAVEPLWRTHGTLLAFDSGSDAMPLSTWRDTFMGRTVRGLELIDDQARLIRKRWLLASYLAGTLRGAYMGLESYHGHYGLEGSVGYSRDIVHEIARTVGEFGAVSADRLGVLENHGYTLADTAVHRHMPEWIIEPAELKLPHPMLADRGAVQRALIEPMGRAA
jgi:NTE family protein